MRLACIKACHWQPLPHAPPRLFESFHFLHKSCGYTLTDLTQIVPPDLVPINPSKNAASGILRPIDDVERIKKMFANSNLVVSDWYRGELIGVERALTDFCYCCYVSDLAVKKEFQNKGVGRKILSISKGEASPQSVFFLHAAPSAKEYYPKIGMKVWDDCFFYPREK